MKGTKIEQAITHIAQAITLLQGEAIKPPGPLDTWTMTTGETITSLHHRLGGTIAAALRAGRNL